MEKIIFLLISTVFLFTSCGLGNGKNDSVDPIMRHDVVIMVDDTEGGLYQWSEILKVEDLVNLFTVEGTQHYGSVTFTDINDVSLNSIKTIKLSEPLPYEEGSTQLLKKMKRESNHRELLNSFLKVSELHKTFIGRNTLEEKRNSILYGPITKAINRLATSKADEKTLIILSDMIENSECGNFYKATACNYTKIIADLILCSRVTLTPNSGVKVIVLFQTTSPEKDKEFTKSMEIWDILFKKAGITYEILPNL